VTRPTIVRIEVIEGPFSAQYGDQNRAGVFDTVGNTTRDGWELESTVYASDSLSFYGSWGEAETSQVR
jgi:outer membrane receptor for ferrienterochelin and colicin